MTFTRTFENGTGRTTDGHTNTGRDNTGRGGATTDIAVYVAPARFDVHAADSFVAFANETFAANRALTIDMRLVDFIDEHTYDAFAAVVDRAEGLDLDCMICAMSPAAALTFEFLNRAAA